MLYQSRCYRNILYFNSNLRLCEALPLDYSGSLTTAPITPYRLNRSCKSISLLPVRKIEK